MSNNLPQNKLTFDQISRRLEREKSARKQAESLLEEKSRELYTLNQKLHQDVHLLEAAVINAKDGVLITDNYTSNSPAKIIYVNKSFLKITGYKEEEVIGKPIDIIHGKETDKEQLPYIQKAITAGEHPGGGLVKYKRDEAEYWLDISISPVLNETNEITNITAIVRDVTEHKDNEERLKQERKKAEIANISKSEFLATMSHELRTPMNGIIGMTELLLDSDLTPKQAKHAEIVINSAESLLSIINDVLDFSKIESGKLDLDFAPFDLLNLSEGITSLLSSRAQEVGLEIIQNYNSATPRFLIGDSVRVGQIIQNLIGNAIKFTESGHVSLSIEEIDGNNNKDEVLIKISVSDTGIGIPKEVQNKIFEKFSQADASTTRKFGGTGLGLNICQELTYKMNGEIGVESVEGKGSTFWATLILKRNPDIQKPQDEYPINLSGLKDIKILIVDDIQLNCDLLEERLTALGAKIFICTNPLEAEKILINEKEKGTAIDMAILDYIMPRMDGCALARNIKSNINICDTALVMLSSAGEKEYIDKLSFSGFSALLHKPVRARELERDIIHIWTSYKNGNTQKLIDLDNLPHIATSKKSNTPKTQPQTFAPMHVLVVEDNETNQMVINALLKKFGHKVTIANNGEESIKCVKNNNYDIIMMDVHMPVMDGMEATRILRQMEHDNKYHVPPIIALTANAMKGDREKCLKAGMNDYISKPIRQDEVREAIERWQAIAYSK